MPQYRTYHYQQLLCVTVEELQAIGVPKITIKVGTSRHRQGKVSCWPHHKEGKRVYVHYDGLREEYQRKITEHLGCDAYVYAARQPIRDLIVTDYKAEAFYEAFTFENGNTLQCAKPGYERQYIARYTGDASILNAIIRVTENKKAFKAALPGMSIEGFWEVMLEVIKERLNSDLPTSKRRLIDHLSRYKAHGYAGLISAKFNNKNSAKIGKTADGYDADIADKQMRVIRALLSKHNHFDNAQIAEMASKLFEKLGFEAVGDGVVRKYRKQFAALITAGNAGAKKHRNTVALQLKREAPKYPLAMVTVDGWTAELLFQERKVNTKGHTYVDYYGRLVIVVVLDPFTKYPLGYAIGERENTNLIKQANLNALAHIQELFGNTYRPWQVQSDRYGIKEMTPFYSAVGHLFTPAAVGNAKSKVVEPYFKYLNKKYCQYDRFWSGFNVNSKKDNQPNTDYLDKIKHDMPTKEEVYQKLVAMMGKERALKVEKYKQGWEKIADEDKALLMREHYLMLFGTKTAKTIRLRGEGIAPEIGGVKHYFDSFDPKFREHYSENWQVYYDAEELQVEGKLHDALVVSEDFKKRFLLEAKYLQPMAIRDQDKSHAAYRAKVNQHNIAWEQRIIQTYIEDNEVVSELVSRVPMQLDDVQEAALKLMFTQKGQQKEGLQDAKKLPSPQVMDNDQEDWEAKHMAYVASKVDINKYLND